MLGKWHGPSAESKRVSFSMTGGIYQIENQLSAEHRAKLSEAKRGKRHPNFGKHLGEATRAKISEGLNVYWRRKREAMRREGNLR